MSVIIWGSLLFKIKSKCFFIDGGSCKLFKKVENSAVFLINCKDNSAGIISVKSRLLVDILALGILVGFTTYATLTLEIPAIDKLNLFSFFIIKVNFDKHPTSLNLLSYGMQMIFNLGFLVNSLNKLSEIKSLVKVTLIFVEGKMTTGDFNGKTNKI